MTMLMYRGNQKERFAAAMDAAASPDERVRLFEAMRFGWEEGAGVALAHTDRPVVEMLELDSVFVEATVV